MTTTTHTPTPVVTPAPAVLTREWITAYLKTRWPQRQQTLKSITFGAFTSKEEYVQGRANWKASYKVLSEMQKENKVHMKETCRTMMNHSPAFPEYWNLPEEMRPQFLSFRDASLHVYLCKELARHLLVELSTAQVEAERQYALQSLVEEGQSRGDYNA